MSESAPDPNAGSIVNPRASVLMRALRTCVPRFRRDPSWVSGMGVLVCSNELTKGAGNVGYRNQVVVLVVLVCDTKTSTI